MHPVRTFALAGSCLLSLAIGCGELSCKDTQTCVVSPASGQAGKAGSPSGGAATTGGSAGAKAGAGRGGTGGASGNGGATPAGTGGSGAESELGGADNGGTGARSSGGVMNGGGGSGGSSQGGETDSAGQTALGGEAGSASPDPDLCGNGSIDPVETCDDGNTKSGDGCGQTCAVESQFSCIGEPSVCTPLSSCAGMVGNECSGADCCASPQVTGGTVELGDPDEVSVSVSTFKLDKFEVTVGRFRRFVSAFDPWRAAGHPAAGEGVNPHLGAATGGLSTWQSSYDTPALFPQTAAALKSNVSCDENYQTWGDDPARDRLPMNCVDWYVAFAFCLWDGGRLPTEAEWEYAAAGGSNNSIYPWGNAPAPDDSDATYAVYNCLGDNNPTACSFLDMQPVGSRPAGIGRYLQLDLAGSMWEWAIDWYASYPTTTPVGDYAKLDGGSTRVVRGGDWNNRAHAYLRAGTRNSQSPDMRSDIFGFRCARDL